MVSYDDSIDLVTRCRRGDRRSLGHLAERIREQLFGYICRMAGNEDLARDILQEVLLTVVRRVRHLKEPESFWQWVVTIARNKMRDYYRRNYARSQAENEFRLRFQNKIKQQGGYEAKRERREALQDIYVLAQKLDRMYSQIIELRCLEGRSYSEIAEITGISSRNSCVRLHRARQILCEKLDKRAGECF